jgi:hypothetical protein
MVANDGQQHEDARSQPTGKRACAPFGWLLNRLKA